MKRLVLIGIGVLVIIGVAAAIFLPRLLDVETHRPAIERAIAAATGRAVKLGPLKLRIFPVPELTASGLTIGEDPAFGTEPFLETDRLQIRVKLLPLLARRMSVESLTVERPQVRIRRDRDGRWSVLTLGVAVPTGPGATPPDAARGGSATESGPPPAAPGSGAGTSFSVDRIAVRGGTLSVVDEAFAAGRTVKAEAHDLDCTITDLSLTSPVGIALSFDLSGVGHAGVEGRLGPLSNDDDGTLPIDLRVELAGGGAILSGKLAGLRGRPAIDARIVTKKAALAEIAPLLELLGPLLPAGLAMKGEIALDAAARGPLDDPSKLRIEGTASVSGLELGDPSLEQPITGIRGSLTFRGDRAEIADFGASLGKSSVSGACTVTRFERPVIDARLDSPLLDLDEILSFLVAAGPAPATATAAPTTGTSRDPNGPPKVAAPLTAEAPPASDASGSLLRDVTVRGDLAVQKARVLNLELANANGKLTLERGAARLSGISVDLYGGRMTGELTAHVADPGPPYTLSARLAGVDFNRLAADFSKDLGGLLTGTLETTLDVRGRGVDSVALQRSLTGRGSLALRDGKLTSISILKTVARALEAAGGRGIGESETPFRSITGTFDIGSGFATTSDLALDSPDIALRGKGKIGLDLSLALNVAAKFSREASADMTAKTAALRYLSDREGRLELDLRMDGTLTSPSVAVDRQMIDRAAKSAVKEKAKEKGEDLLKRFLGKRK